MTNQFKIYKKIAATLLVVLMAVMLFACASTSDSSDSSDSSGGDGDDSSIKEDCESQCAGKDGDEYLDCVEKCVQ